MVATDFSAQHPVTIPVAWGDMDALGHVNNTVYSRWFETARIEWFARVDIATTGGSIGPILARTELDFRSPVTWPDTVEVAIGVLSVGRTSIKLGYRVTSQKQSRVVAEGVTVVVLYDYSTKQSVPLDDALRARIAP